MYENSLSQEQWIPTSCNGCFSACAIRALRKDGKVVDVKGDPDVESAMGKICGKGIARIAEVYDPRRALTPLKRTNPEKGIGVDPKWVEITWEEAMDTIVEKLSAVREDDPRKLMIADFDIHNLMMPAAFGEAFGTPNYTWSSIPCGNGLHTVFYLTLGGLNSEIDLENCNYIMLWGSQLGHGSNNNPLEAIRHMADARRRKAKLVVVDPVCGHAAAKADEWVPILPGTDAALALGMSNIMINELGLYDEEFLKSKTNAPYLTDEKGRYVRHSTSGKPMVWDLGDDTAKEFDDAAVKDPAITGTYQIDGKSCTPSFDRLKNHLKTNYPLDRVSRITTVPESTIHRLAKEFGEAACIGEWVEIDGHKIRRRPAALEFKRGITHHKNSYASCFSLMIPNLIVGNPDAVGGIQGTAPYGPLATWGIEAGKDGLVTTNQIERLSGGHDVMGCFYKPYPPAEHGPPTRLTLRELLPASGFISMLPWLVLDDPERVKLPYRPSVLINCRNNVIMSHINSEKIAQLLKKFDFIIGFAIKINETLEFADVILPEAHDFEKWWTLPSNLPAGFQKAGMGRWYFQVTQPVVEPPEGVRNWSDVMMEIAHRVGFGDKMNEKMNAMFGLGMIPELALKPDQVYTVEEIVSRSKQLYAMASGKEPSKTLFTEAEPVLDIMPKTVKESYPIQLSDVRVPIYMEYLLDLGEEVGRLTRDLGMDWWDLSHYAALPEWRPCPAHEEEGYDLYLHTGKVPLSTHTISTENPWIQDVCSRNRMDFNIVINRETGEKKGLKDGDTVVVESKIGRVKGRVRLSEAIHPQVVAHFTQSGHWARDSVGSKNRPHLNSLVSLDWDMVGTVTGQVDTCAKVKIYRQ